MAKLSGKVAIVTGGGQAIGQAIVERFVVEGASVAIVDISGREKDVAAALGMKYALPVMAAQGAGAIVNTASALSYVGMPGQATYAGTKAAVVQMSRTAAWEYGARGVRVNALSPGGVRTEIAERFFADNPEHEAH